MKKLSLETKNKLLEQAIKNNTRIEQIFKFVGDFGKYKERKKYLVSDADYLQEIDNYKMAIFSAYGRLSVAVELLKLYGKEKQFEDTIKELNEMMQERFNAEQEARKNQELENSPDSAGFEYKENNCDNCNETCKNSVVCKMGSGRHG